MVRDLNHSVQGFAQSFILVVVHIVEFGMFVNFVDYPVTILSNLLLHLATAEFVG